MAKEPTYARKRTSHARASASGLRRARSHANARIQHTRTHAHAPTHMHEHTKQTRQHEHTDARRATHARARARSKTHARTAMDPRRPRWTPDDLAKTICLPRVSRARCTTLLTICRRRHYSYPYVQCSHPDPAMLRREPAGGRRNVEYIRTPLHGTCSRTGINMRDRAAVMRIALPSGPRRQPHDEASQQRGHGPRDCGAVAPARIDPHSHGQGCAADGQRCSGNTQHRYRTGRDGEGQQGSAWRRREESRSSGA
jgi:hypothetical protein